MIAVICSECNEGILGLDEEACTFQPGERIQSRQFFKLTSIGWAATKPGESIDCPKCGTRNIIKDITRIWKEESDKRRKK